MRGFFQRLSSTMGRVETAAEFDRRGPSSDAAQAVAEQVRKELCEVWAVMSDGRVICPKCEMAGREISHGHQHPVMGQECPGCGAKWDPPTLRPWNDSTPSR